MGAAASSGDLAVTAGRTTPGRHGSAYTAYTATSTVQPYQLVDINSASAVEARANVIDNLEAQMLHHAVITWALLPAFVICMAVLPEMQPDCFEGFPNWTLLVVLLVEIHHIYAESQAWSAVKALVTIPELTVLRQFGVLKSRRRLVLLGILESIDLYTDLTFPLVARACDAELTTDWERSWSRVPVFGHFMEHALEYLRFWGCTLLVTLVTLLVVGFWNGLLSMPHCDDQVKRGPLDKGLPGDVFFGWARSAETAMMPSVALMCEEMASQKRYRYDSSKNTAAATQARVDVVFGKLDSSNAEAMEVGDQEEEARVHDAEVVHFVLLVVFKVFIGNVIQLWLQGSFFALTYDETGWQAKGKVAFSMVISSMQAVFRAKKLGNRLGIAGVFLIFIVVIFVLWALAKIVFSYHCSDHLWNLSTGCVEFHRMHGRKIPANHTAVAW